MDAGDEKLDPPVAVISDRFWRGRLGGDPSVLGKTIRVRQRTFTIAGVTPAEFWGLQPGSPVDVTIPITVERRLMGDPGAWWFQIVARLRPGVAVETALAEADPVFQSFMAQSRHPADVIRMHFHHLEMASAAQGMDVLRRRFSQPLFALMGIVGLVLLMATVNVANLLLARGIARQREFAIRLAAGAGRWRLMRQLVTETLLLFAFGTVPGVALSVWGVDAIQGVFAEGRRAIALDAGMNWRILAFTLGITLLAGLVSAVLPVWWAFRTDPEQALKEGPSRMTESRGAVRLTRAMVAFQVALSLVLLVGALTFTRTLQNLRNVNTGFQNLDVLTMSLGLPEGYGAVAKPAALWNRVLTDIRAEPGVRAAGLSTFTPLSGRDRGSLVKIPGFTPAVFQDAIVHVNQVSEGYFETLGIALVRGRLLTERDADGSPRVALINESAARQYFRERDPLGESFAFDRQEPGGNTYRIVGVVRDTKHMNLREPAPRFVYLPLRQAGDAEDRLTLAVAAAPAMLDAIQRKVKRIDEGLLISDVISIRKQMDSTLLTERLLAGLSAAFGALALLLACVGLFGVLSYRVGQQRHSIGIRMALGAAPSAVAMGVLRQSGMLVGAGLLVGLPFAYLAARAADSMLWGVTPGDAAVYLVGIGVLCLVGLFSAYPPARRAAAIEPAEALRQE